MTCKAARTARRYRQHAAEAKALAGETENPVVKGHLLQQAANFLEMAEQADLADDDAPPTGAAVRSP